MRAVGEFLVQSLCTTMYICLFLTLCRCRNCLIYHAVQKLKYALYTRMSIASLRKRCSCRCLLVSEKFRMQMLAVVAYG